MPRIFVVLLISLAACGCCMPSGTIALSDTEREGVEALLETIAEFAESTDDPRPGHVHDHLLRCLQEGNMTRGQCGEAHVLGRTCGEAVCLDSALPYDVNFLRRNATACMLALAVLFHEGVHLDQDFSDFLFDDHEEDAYLFTHEMQIWLAKELGRRRMPIDAATFDQDAAFEGLEEARRGMGTAYLSEICPAHIRRDRLEDFIRRHPEENLAWVEVPPRPFPVELLDDGRMRIVLDFDRVLGKLSGQIKTTYLGRDDAGRAPTWKSPVELIKASESLDFIVGWYVVERDDTSHASTWNRDGIAPRKAEIRGDRLALDFDVPPGQSQPEIACGITILLLPKRSD